MTDRDPRYFDDIEVDLGDDERPRKPRRRARMGEVVSQLGRRSTARPRVTDAEKAVEQRERSRKAKELLDGGKSKGEEKGYGVARTRGGDDGA